MKEFQNSKTSRVDDEKKEGLEQISNDVPKGKFQGEQQIQDTFDANKTSAPKSGFDLVKEKHKGASLKQEVASSIVSGKDYIGPSGVTGISLRSFGGVSGSGGGILGASNATPEASKSRSDSRYGKKLDKIATKMNYIPSEQVLVDYDEAPALSENPESTVGYNGTYRNEFHRSQKASGAVPGDLMFDRSVDMIFRDEVYYSMGQQIDQKGMANNDTPTEQAVKQSNGNFDYPAPGVVNYNVKRGNFLNRAMHATLDDNGKVMSLGFDVIDCSTYVDSEVADQAASNSLIDRNYAELNRETMDTKAGDEKAEIWTPLARAIKQPTKVNGYLRDLDAMTGSEIFLNYKKASTSLAFQLNRAVKDGQDTIRPAVEAFRGIHEEAPNSSSYDGSSVMTGIFTEDEYKKGSAALMIAMYDTVNKYSNKADFLLQPRSLRMHLQTADNNMNAFRVHKNFVTIVNEQETFSTIDRDYDPMLPVCITDKAAIIHPYNFNDLYGFVKSSVSVSTGSAGSAITRQFASKQALSTLNGLYLTYKSSGSAPTYLSNVITIPDSTNVEFVISPSVNTGYTSLGIIGDTLTFTDDITFSGKITSVVSGNEKRFGINKGTYSYLYSDLRNYYKLEVSFPLLAGICNYIDSGAGLLMKKNNALGNNKLYVPMVASTQFYSLWSFLLCAATPFINTERIQSFRDVIYYQDNIGEYPYNQLIAMSDAPTKAASNYSFSDYDNPLESKIMKPEVAISWYMPEFFWNISGEDIFACSPKTGASAADDSYTVFTNNSGSSMTVYCYQSKDTELTVTRSTRTLNVAGTGKVAIRVTTSSTAPSGFKLIGTQSVSLSDGQSITVANAANYTVGISSTAVLPWYFNEEEYDFTSNSFTRAEDVSAFSLPSIRSGARLSFLDNFYGMEAKDILLGLDRIVDVFTYDTYNGSTGLYPNYIENSKDFGAYKYGLTTDGQPFVTFDNGITLKQYLRMPRMLGWSFVAPYGSLTPTYTSLASENSDVINGTCYRIKYFTNDNITANEYGDFETTNRKEGVNISRAANFKQVWHQAFADGVTVDHDYGMIFGLSDLFRPVNNKSGTQALTYASDASFAPFVDVSDGNSTNKNFKLLSMQKAFWTRIQKLPFVISPFDGFNAVGTTPSNMDIYDLAYMFGLCGFRAVDYREEVYNREKQVVNQGRLYISDPFIENSPLFKEGYSVSDLKKTKGYEFNKN